MKVLFLLISIILLTGCSSDNCVSSHKEKQKCIFYISKKIGPIYIKQPIKYNCYKTVCDEYEVYDEEAR